MALGYNFIASGTIDNYSSQALGSAFTPANNSLLVVALTTYAQYQTPADPNHTVSGGSLTWTRQAVTTLTGDFAARVEIWTAPVTTGASTTVSVSVTNPGYYLGWSITNWTGVDTSSPVGLSAVGGSYDSPPGGSAYTLSMGGTSAATSAVVASVVTTQNDQLSDGTFGAPSGWTAIHTAANSFFGWSSTGSAYKAGAVSSVSFPSSKTTTADFGIAAIELKEAGSGGSSPFASNDWPNPARRPSQAATQAHIDPSEMWLLAPAAVAAPFAGVSQPNPVLRARDVSNLGFVDPSEFWLVKPFNQQHWPVPRPAPLRTIAHDGFTEVPSPSQLLTGAKPFAQNSWPNPVLRRGDVSNLGYVDGSEHWLFAAVQPKPFAQTDWPLPRGPAPRLNGGFTDASEFWFLKDTFFGAEGQPPQPFDWPTPRASGRLNGSFVDAYPNRGVVVTPAPFAQYDWPIPRARPGAHVGFVSAYAVSYLQPFAQNDWPLPGRRSSPNTGFVSPGLAASIPYSLDPPFVQEDWPLPGRRPPLNTGFTSAGLSLTVAPPPPAPFAQDDWPLPGRGRPPLNVGFALPSLALGVPTSLDLPFVQRVWPIPASRPWTISGFTSPGLALTAIDTPFAQTDWPLPRSRINPERGFNASLNIGLLLQPAPTPAWDLPQAGVRRSPAGFVCQADAARLTLLFVKPFANNDWPNPVRQRVITVASSMRPSQNLTIHLPTDGYVPRSDGAALLI